MKSGSRQGRKKLRATASDGLTKQQHRAVTYIRRRAVDKVDPEVATDDRAHRVPRSAVLIVRNYQSEGAAPAVVITDCQVDGREASEIIRRKDANSPIAVSIWGDRDFVVRDDGPILR